MRFAAVAAAALLAGVLPGTNSAASGGEGEISLAYACQFISGEQDVTVAFAQTYPHSGTVGKPIRPGELTMTVSIPRAGATAILPARADTVTGSAELKPRVTQGTSQAVADWRDLTADAAPVAGTGDLVIGFTGQVPGVLVTATGEVTFSAGDLALTLHPRPAPEAPGTPTAGATATATATGGTADTGTGAVAAPTNAPPADTATDVPPADTPTGGQLADLTGSCAAKPGQDLKLATVSVPHRSATGAPVPGRSAAGGSGTAGATGQSTTGAGSSPSMPDGSRPGTGGTIVALDEPTHSGRTTCDAPPTDPIDPKRLPPPPNDGTVIILPLPGMSWPPQPMCGYVTGFSNVNKLNGAMIVNDPNGKMALENINSGVRRVIDNPGQYIEYDHAISLRLPPSHSTFLTYGFMPTTADVDLVSLGVMTGVQTGSTFWNQPILTTISGYQDIRIHHVKINGTPLDVGPDCHTATPADVVLKGREDNYLPGGGDGKPDYDIQNGGPLTDDNLVIPPFTGCHSHGENLDALFTASLSGPGNTLNLSQGGICDPVNAPEETCQPEIKIPPLPVRR